MAGRTFHGNREIVWEGGVGVRGWEEVGDRTGWGDGRGASNREVGSISRTNRFDLRGRRPRLLAPGTAAPPWATFDLTRRPNASVRRLIFGHRRPGRGGNGVGVGGGPLLVWGRFVICDLSFVICHSSFVICDLSFVILCGRRPRLSAPNIPPRALGNTRLHLMPNVSTERFIRGHRRPGEGMERRWVRSPLLVRGDLSFVICHSSFVICRLSRRGAVDHRFDRRTVIANCHRAAFRRHWKGRCGSAGGGW